MGKHERTPFDHARDELYRQIHRCGVLEATPEQQEEWLRDSMGFFEGQFPELSDAELRELREMGDRFCQPPIPHGKRFTEENREDWQGDEEPAAAAAAEAGSEAEAVTAS